MRTVNVIEGIFFAAIEKKTPADRNAYLDQACAGDAELRGCVERMLDGQADPAQRANTGVRVDPLRQQFISLPFDDAAAEQYGRIRADLTGRGLLSGGNDMLIAAMALAKGCTLVTHNTAEFSRVAGLMIEDWQVP